jgi:hypothetical protein
LGARWAIDWPGTNRERIPMAGCRYRYQIAALCPVMKGVDDLAAAKALATAIAANYIKSASKSLTVAHFFAVQLAFMVRTLTHPTPLVDIVTRFANARRG